MKKYDNVIILAGMYNMNNKIPQRTIIVFGDNSVRRGLAGQACVRHARNSFGIVTKFLPSTTPDAYFTDERKSEALTLFRHDLVTLHTMANYGDLTVGFPINGLGTGMARVPSLAPKTFKAMMGSLSRYFAVKWDEDIKQLVTTTKSSL